MRFNKFFTLLFIAAMFICPAISLSAQIAKSNQLFTEVKTFEDKVVFIKELSLSSSNPDKNYLLLKEWGKINFAKDPFNSSINYDDRKKSITAQSRIELVLPENHKSIREKLIMKYRLNAFFQNGLCIMEITNINYINDYKKNNNSLNQKIKAEDLITDKAISIDDPNQETRINTKKNTLYFFNDLVNSLQNFFNN